MAFDTDRGVLVLWGGTTGETDTWEWNGANWTLAASIGPSRRHSPAMAYDRLRHKTVLAGGVYNGAYFSEVWEWDGTSWTPRADTPLPEARQQLAMVFDTARGVMVAYGGLTTGGVSSYANATKTLEYDGSTWAIRTSAFTPGARYGHAMAYDIARNRTVLIDSARGSGDIVMSEWDGSNWMTLSFDQQPPQRLHPALAYDEGRDVSVLMGGDGFNDTWEYDGLSWTQRTSNGATSGRDEHAMAYDTVRQRTLMFGGLFRFSNGAITNPKRDLWFWTGAAWYNASSRVSPPPHWWPGHCYDELRGVTVTYGGVGVCRDGFVTPPDNVTWMWNGTTWNYYYVASNNPGGRSRAPLVYDTIRGVTILYGGMTTDNNVSAIDAVWEWSGTQWTQRPSSPAGSRSRHAAAFDRSRGRMVVFGGDDRNGVSLGDTWEYDGSTWVQMAIGDTAPMPRENAAMVFDSARGKMVLFGGSTGSPTTYLNDTWEWDGAEWTEVIIPSQSRPAVRNGHMMAYDPDHHRVFLMGGNGPNNAVRNNQWVFDGIQWTQLSGNPEPIARMFGAMEYDTARQAFVLVGGAPILNSQFGSSQT